MQNENLVQSTTFSTTNSTKRKTHIILVALLSLICVFTLCACNKEKKALSFLETSYDIILEFSDDMKTVELSEEVLFTNTSQDDLKEIKFHIYPNAFSESAVASSLLKIDENTASSASSEKVGQSDAFCEMKKSDNLVTSASCGKVGQADFLRTMKHDDFGGIDILSVRINRKTMDFTISGVDKTILAIPFDIASGLTCTIDIEAIVTIPTCDTRFGKTASTINFTGFYPTLCVYENGAWREDPYYQIGDPFYSNIASFYVNVSIPSKYTVATSGYIADEWQEDGKKCMDIVAESIRDFAMVVSDGFTLQTKSAELSKKTVTINYYYYDDTNSLGTVNLAISAIETFSKVFGDYPYSHFSVVQSPLNAGGMEYGSLVIIAPMKNRTQADETLVHETAHQWWYGVVGSDQLSSAWLDEGLTEFCTGYYYKLNKNATKYNSYIKGIRSSLMFYSTLPSSTLKGAPIDKHLSSFNDDNEYVATVYLKGALLFDSILDFIGEAKFNKSLATYYSNNAFKIASKESLIQAFEQNGCHVGSIINGWVSGVVA